MTVEPARATDTLVTAMNPIPPNPVRTSSRRRLGRLNAARDGRAITRAYASSRTTGRAIEQAIAAMASGVNERRATPVAGYAAPYRTAAPAARRIPVRSS